MDKLPPKKTKKRSAAAEAISWVVDLGVLGLLIWYFSNPINQSTFFGTIGGWVSGSVGAAVDFRIKHLCFLDTVIKTQASSPLHATVKSSVSPSLPTVEHPASELAGDCIPPEPLSHDESVSKTGEIAVAPSPIPKPLRSRHGHGKPLKFAKRTIRKISFYQITVDLNDPDAYLVIGLPNKSEQANSATFYGGHENFESFVKRYHAAAIVNGTFFSKDEQERVMGNMVSEGKKLKYSEWENYGTTLGLRAGDRPEMITARDEGRPQWDKHWFSLTCGPRLIKHGEVWVNPELEGFADSHVLGIGPRSALGFTETGDKLYLITFLQGLSLKEEAKLMKEIGCYEAMNLDGGASKGLSLDNNVVVKPGRALTNVLVVYDCKHKAPEDVVAAWQEFQGTDDK